MDSTNKGHVSPSFSDFLMASSFFYSNNSYRSMLTKKLAALHATGRLARAKFASVWLCHS
jgi:hypothetical protein